MRGLFRKKQEKKTYDRENQQPVLHCSICTGETAAEFKDMRTGKFEEVMLIRKDEDLKQFMEMYGIDSIRKEY